MLCHMLSMLLGWTYHILFKKQKLLFSFKESQRLNPADDCYTGLMAGNTIKDDFHAHSGLRQLSCSS